MGRKEKAIKYYPRGQGDNGDGYHEDHEESHEPSLTKFMLHIQHKQLMEFCLLTGKKN